ncbi:hypothetical protein [Marinilabilia rubra]|nr:hypothetical protein [Marinilabilia rubra]
MRQAMDVAFRADFIAAVICGAFTRLVFAGQKKGCRIKDDNENVW